jgi:hypothetical protein
MSNETEHVAALRDIRDMMQRSSKFISLSGLSGIAAGTWALAGAWFAARRIGAYYDNYAGYGYTGHEFQRLEISLLVIAAAVLAAAIVSAFYFTWRRARKKQQPVWDPVARRMIINMLIPLIAGGLFILAMLRYDEWRFVAPLCLVFYGLALVNGSRYTVSDIRWLGICEIILGLVCTQFIGYGLYFWAIGFGFLHILYGFLMWWKYERAEKEN